MQAGSEGRQGPRGGRTVTRAGAEVGAVLGQILSPWRAGSGLHSEEVEPC